MKITLIVMLNIFSLGCFIGDKSANLNEKFVLKNEEVARILGTELQIKAADEVHEFNDRDLKEHCRFKVLQSGVATHFDTVVGETTIFANTNIQTVGGGIGWCTFLVKKK